MQEADDETGAAKSAAVIVILEVQVFVAVESIASIRTYALLHYAECQRGMNAIPSGMAPSPYPILNS